MTAHDHLSEVQFLPLREVAGMKSADYGGRVGDIGPKYLDSVPDKDADYHDKPGEEMRQQRALTRDVQKNGIRTPITLRRYPDSAFGPASIELGDGHHRVLAAMHAGLTHVPVRYDDWAMRQRRR